MPFPKPPPRIRYRCSFCGKSQEQVHRLIAGPGGVYICNACVQVCQEILEEEQAAGGARALAQQFAALRATADRLEAENTTLRERLRAYEDPEGSAGEAGE